MSKYYERVIINKYLKSDFNLKKLRFKMNLLHTKAQLTLFYYNSLSYDFYYVADDNYDLSNFPMYSRVVSKVYKINSIRGFELIDNSTLVTSKTSNFGKILGGALLFGGIGAIAGAIDKGGNVKTRRDSNFIVRLIMDDVNNASVELKCENSEIAYNLLYTLSLLEEKYYKDENQKSKTQSVVESISDMLETKQHNKIIKNNGENDQIKYKHLSIIKELFDNGIISEDEYLEMKKRVINN